MLNVRFLVNVTEAEHHDASVSKETETLARSSREVLRTLRNTVDFGGRAHFVYKSINFIMGHSSFLRFPVAALQIRFYTFFRVVDGLLELQFFNVF
ncbi:hypothetical protein NDU88_001489 [Pleurodeles waltl]|uniref:Uncharacterized protein n=1 Tax=Pleurodeles waltl TaxID=8319 RepID=A0AAV7SCE9_PLEWA|nr:hypothetical protein NDU88_001489 [Pleurodeles waltl]